MKDLRVGPPTHLTRATEHIPEMATLIAKLLENGHAYRTDERVDLFPHLVVARLRHIGQ